ncbi:MAG TPA: hypothetical protein ENI64_08750 [Gammaproteobacteria bacterium]|nr:hypothetical protein [Gammaproteobacteria bacterium]
MTKDRVGDALQDGPLMLSNLKRIPVTMKDPADGSNITISRLSSGTINGKLFTAYKRYTKRLIEMME